MLFNAHPPTQHNTGPAPARQGMGREKTSSCQCLLDLDLDLNVQGTYHVIQSPTACHPLPVSARVRGRRAARSGSLSGGAGRGTQLGNSQGTAILAPLAFPTSRPATPFPCPCRPWMKCVGLGRGHSRQKLRRGGGERTV